ncbi:M23 family metallopeptidase [Membranihabitans maritimus]|uniref:M23 family metallopeptidase n=1 Tax=Membranihabitans maritimus TaxID=2904244 RepID=UPI001F2C13FD|nr:M23 family metallopeptidase [Membranihabitans maritimus]
MENRFRIIVVAFLSIFCTCLLFSQQGPIKISYDKNKSGSVFIKYRKSKPGSYFFILTFDHLHNTYSSGYKGVIKDPFGKLVTLKPEDRYKGINFSYKTSSTRGIPNPSVDSSIIYSLPFRPGLNVGVEVIEDFEEKTYKDKIQPKDWQILHFKLPDGDTVVASRKGMVVAVENQNNYNDRSGSSVEPRDILVEHEDGTFASYASNAITHTFVEPGDKVFPGTPLGLLENSEEGDPIDLYFKTYYLILKSLDDKNESILSNTNAEYQYFSPTFQTSKGTMKLENNQEYGAEMSNIIIFQELSKRDQRKWMKEHAN